MVKKKIYSTNYLTNVICKIDFPKVLELTENKPPSEFQKRIADRFPFANETRNALEPSKINWEFKNRGKDKRVLIDPEYIYVEYFKFKKFNDYIEDVGFVFEKLLEVYPIKLTTRIGLRYINQIRLDKGDPINWNGMINETLFSVPNNFVKNKKSIVRSMHNLIIKEPDFDLIFNFGLFNSDAPNPISKKEFVLDYDCYTSGVIETSDVIKKIKHFNKIDSEWFELSILDGLRKKMGVKT